MANNVSVKLIPKSRRKSKNEKNINRQQHAREYINDFVTDLRNITFHPIQYWQVYERCNATFYTNEIITKIKQNLSILKFHSEFKQILEVKRNYWDFRSVELFHDSIMIELEKFAKDRNYTQIVYPSDNDQYQHDVFSDCISDIKLFELDYIALISSSDYQGNGSLNLESMCNYGRKSKTILKHIYTALYILTEHCQIQWWHNSYHFDMLTDDYELEQIEDRYEQGSDDYNNAINEAREFNKSDWRFNYNDNFMSYINAKQLCNIQHEIALLRNFAYKKETRFTIWLRAVLWLTDNKFTISKFSIAPDNDDYIVKPEMLYTILPNFDDNIIYQLDERISASGNAEFVGLSNSLLICSNGSKIEINSDKESIVLNTVFGFNFYNEKYAYDFIRLSDVDTLCNLLSIQKLRLDIRRDCETKKR